MAVRFFLLAASAAVLASAQGVSPGCTAKSFSYPSWLIQDVKHTAKNVTFSISNRVTDYKADLACQYTKTGLNACSIQGTPAANDTLQVSVLLENPKLYVVKQSWECSDRGKLLTFTAQGNASAAENYTSPLLVRGSLTSPVAITPEYPDGPTGHNSPGCTTNSEKPSWVLTAIHYTDEPGDGVTSTPFKNFNAIVTNPANGYQASCIPGGGNFGDPNNLSRLTCAGVEFQSSSVGSYPISTTASFDPETLAFSLNQTWFCDDTDAAKPLKITATGATTLSLTCNTETTATNQTNQYCSNLAPSIPLSGTLGTVTTLHPYSLTDPVPSSRGDGCTLTSIFSPRWQFSDFQINGGSVTFEVILAAADRGFQYPIPIYQGAPVKGGEEKGWYECEIGADGGNGLPLWPYKCSFRYEGEGKGLELRAEWECRDLDGGHPVKFSGVTTTTVNSTLTCETVDGESRCATTDPGYTWAAGIANVTWGKSA